MFRRLPAWLQTVVFVAYVFPIVCVGVAIGTWQRVRRERGTRR